VVLCSDCTEPLGLRGARKGWKPITVVLPLVRKLVRALFVFRPTLQLLWAISLLLKQSKPLGLMITGSQPCVCVSTAFDNPSSTINRNPNRCPVCAKRSATMTDLSANDFLTLALGLDVQEITEFTVISESEALELKKSVPPGSIMTDRSSSSNNWLNLWASRDVQSVALPGRCQKSGFPREDEGCWLGGQPTSEIAGRSALEAELKANHGFLSVVINPSLKHR
jgi:hypothetical protein